MELQYLLFLFSRNNYTCYSLLSLKINFVNLFQEKGDFRFLDYVYMYMYITEKYIDFTVYGVS